MRSLLSFFFSSLFIFYWRIIPLQNFAVLCQTSTWISHAAAAAKSLQLCPTLCDPIDSSPPGSPVPGILQARKWRVKVKSLSRVRLLATPWTTAHQAPPSMGFSRQEYWSGLPLPSPLSMGFFRQEYWSGLPLPSLIICIFLPKWHSQKFSVPVMLSPLLPCSISPILFIL